MKTAQLIKEEKQATELDEANEIITIIRLFNSIFDRATHHDSELKNLKGQLSDLMGVGTDLTAELDFDRLFPIIISKVTKVMSVERTSLYMIDRD